MIQDDIDLEAELDRLYSRPAAEFVAARNELAKRLRQAGDRDAAGRTKKLAKPSMTAWAVNQLAFRAGSELEGLRAAGEKVRAAHLAGPKEQQAAAKARRDAISTLRVIAEVALQEAGVTPNRSHRQRISQTLEVLSSQGTDPDSQRAGRLSADLEPAGFDALTDLAAALAASQKARPAVKAKPVAAKSATAKPVAPEPRPKVVEHPSSKPRKDPAASQATARRAAERHQLDRRREGIQTKLKQLAERLADLAPEAERATAELDQAKRAEAALIEAAREAERLANEARGRAEGAARVTAQARRDAEAASAAQRRAEAEVAKARKALADSDAARKRLED